MNSFRNEAIELQYLIFRTFSIIKKQADSIYRKHNLTGAQVGVLSLLSEKVGKPMNKLSDELWCDVSNITGVVDRLEKNGLVWRSSNPEDRRVNLICITEMGKKSLSETLPENEQVLIDHFGKLNSDERTTLIKLLRKLTE